MCIKVSSGFVNIKFITIYFSYQKFEINNKNIQVSLFL